MDRENPNLTNRAEASSPAMADSRNRVATPLDFRRPDRIAKSQLRSIHQLHETFVRSLAASLSAYLRSYLIARLVSIEQLSCVEFLECLPVPTCVVSLGLKPFEGNAVMEINPSLVFPILEILLGGDGKVLFSGQREITEIEQVLLEGLFRLILRDLRQAWKSVTDIEFNVEKMERNPQQLRMLSPSEAVVAIAIEMRIGDASGMLNIAMPSINIKMMRQKFDQQWTLRKTGNAEADQRRNLRLISKSRLASEVRLNGCELSMRDLADLEVGQVVNFQAPRNSPLELMLNGQSKYHGSLVTSGRRAGLRIVNRITDPAHALRRAW